MRPRLTPLLGVLLLAASALPLAPGAADAAPASLVRNGSFERDDDLDLMPDGWTAFGSPDSVGRASVLAAKEGLWALEVADPADAARGGVVSDPIPVTPGQSLLLGAWMHLVYHRTDVSFVTAPPTTFGVEYEGLALPAPHVSVAVPGGTAGWTRVQVPLLVPHGVETLRIRFDPRGPSVLRADDVTLVPTSNANLLPNPSFETGHAHNMPDLWPMPCGTQNGIWLTPGLTDGGRKLYFLENVWPTCSDAITVPFVLAPGAYRLTGDRYLVGSDATMQIFVYDAATTHGAGQPLAHHSLTVKDVGRGVTREERIDLCAPPGTAKGHVLLTAPLGNSPMYWDNMKLVRTGDCP